MFKSCGLLLVRPSSPATVDPHSHHHHHHATGEHHHCSHSSHHSRTHSGTLHPDGKPSGFDVLVLVKKRTREPDLAKGHMETGESEHETALRELREETGIDPASITLDPSFRYLITRQPSCSRHGGQQVEKTVVVFVGYVDAKCVVDQAAMLRDHLSYQWLPLYAAMHVPHLDPLFKAAWEHLVIQRPTL
eukprot:TRINITY_DN1076_c0_g1_i2.p1 TRINITY_DN1076_c0_g1~~TRINITY_DN1076_c0_g1_i2.p1  ORF type:complete len:216 (-),score=57.09 TRINITY_DN1076_c0_g1_i2:88-657(-)